MMTKKRCRYSPCSKPGHPRERGVVLIVVLVLLVLVSLMSVRVMRGSLNNDLVANNSRTQLLATEMAQLALRFGENDLGLAKTPNGAPVVFTGTTPILPAAADDAGMAWHDPQKWISAAEGSGAGTNAHILPTSALQSANFTLPPRQKLPQCLAEYSPGSSQIIVLTCRGFSPDYTEDNNKIQSGSVVWLQSRFIF